MHQAEAEVGGGVVELVEGLQQVEVELHRPLPDPRRVHLWQCAQARTDGQVVVQAALVARGVCSGHHHGHRTRRHLHVVQDERRGHGDVERTIVAVAARAVVQPVQLEVPLAIAGHGGGHAVHIAPTLAVELRVHVHRPRPVPRAVRNALPVAGCPVVDAQAGGRRIPGDEELDAVPDDRVVRIVDVVRVVPEGAVQPAIVLRHVELDEVGAIEHLIGVAWEIDRHLLFAAEDLDLGRIHGTHREAGVGEGQAVDAPKPLDGVDRGRGRGGHPEGPVAGAVIDPLIAEHLLRLSGGGGEQQEQKR